MATVEKVCSRCGAPFGCGRDAAGCWCTELPPLPAAALDGSTDCLCPRCLAARVATVTRDAGNRAPQDDVEAAGAGE